MARSPGERAASERRRNGRVPHIALRLVATPGVLPIFRHTLSAFAGAQGADGALQGAVALAVSEAVSNAIVHAYADRATPGLVWVEADIEGGELEIVVSDSGVGMGATTGRPGLGLGLGIIARHADQLAISDRRPRGTEVWMRFQLRR